jgi:hypothetical protein
MVFDIVNFRRRKSAFMDPTSRWLSGFFKRSAIGKRAYPGEALHLMPLFSG